jgi:phage terminase large subunit-like protein
LTKALPADVRRGDGAAVCDFIELLRVTKDTVGSQSGERLVLRDWQRRLLGQMFARRADGHRRFRSSLVGIARKNGKSALLSGIALYGLLMEGDGAEVYSVAGDRDQARIVFEQAKRMLEMDEDFSDLVRPYRDAIEVPSTGSVYRVLSSESRLAEGLSPTLVCFDELHVQPNDDLWNVMSLGSGARVDPLVIAITTAGSRTYSNGQDSICYRLYQHGKRVVSGEEQDPSFFFAWWEPDGGETADHADRVVLAQANPGIGDLVSLEDLETSRMRVSEAEYRTKRTNVFVVAQESALPHGAWAENVDADRVVPDGAEIVLGFDGSWSGDSTGLVGCTLDGHLFVVDAWESLDDQHWRVPIADVEARIRESCRRFRVREVVCDPFRWQRTMQVLEDDGIPVVEWPTNSVGRIVPAWQRFYDAVLDGRLSHSGDARLARHLENMRIKRDARGGRPVKDAKDSRRKIDLGICAVIAYDRACARVDDDELVPMMGWM